MSGWNEVVGHTWATSILREAVQNDRVGHANLITGPQHIGKTTLAVTFAQSLNCLSGDVPSRPCGHCRACRLIQIGRHPDVIMIEGTISGRGKRTIKIDEIRSLQQKLTLTATEARYKIAILNQFESATRNASSAFLKTLEEPPSRVILILNAISAEALLPTIPSRCRIINLRPLKRTLIREALIERWDVPEDKANQLAHLADGRVGWAVSAWQEPELLEHRERQITLLYEGIQGSKVGRFKLSQKVTKDLETIPELLSTWLSWWRDLSLVVNGVSDFEMITNIDQIDVLKKRARQWSADSVVICLKKTEQAIWQIDHNANGRLVLENMLLAYPASA
jgi:DNA polymerase-3 subunit delta'